MLEHIYYIIVKRRAILYLGMAIALLHWFGMGTIRINAFEWGGFIDAFLPSGIHDLWTRSLVICIIVAFSIFAQKVANTLYDNSKRYQTLFEEAPDAIFLVDSKSGLITDANPAASRLLLRPHHEIVGLNQSKLCHRAIEDDSIRISAAQVEESKNQRGPQFVEHVILRSDGKEVPVEIMSKTIYLGNHRILQSIFRDISERKKADQAIRLSEERYRSVVDDTPVLLCSSLPDGEITFVNKAYCKYFGKTSEELIG